MGPITRRHPEMRCALQWIGLIPTISALYSPLHAVQRRDSVPVLVRVEDRTRVGPRNRVVMRDARTGADREVYRSDGDIPFQVALSPDGDRVAFIEVVGPVGARKQRLVVTDLSGRSVRVLGESGLYGERGVRDYTWCCSSAKLAIITGVVGEAVRPVAESLYVVDVQTGAEQFIEGVPRPLQVAWAAFDSSLYIKCAPPPEARGKPGDPASPVYRYHVPSGRLSRTTHRGIFFSPDGNYYFDVRWAEDSGFRLYRASDDENITSRLALSPRQLGPDAMWALGAGHVLVFIEKEPRAPEPKPGRQPDRFQLTDRHAPLVYPDRWNVEVDAETGRVIDRFQGDIHAGWKTNAPTVPVERRSGVELVRPRRP